MRWHLSGFIYYYSDFSSPWPHRFPYSALIIVDTLPFQGPCTQRSVDLEFGKPGRYFSQNYSLVFPILTQLFKFLHIPYPLTQWYRPCIASTRELFSLDSKCHWAELLSASSMVPSTEGKLDVQSVFLFSCCLLLSPLFLFLWCNDSW